MSSKRIAIGRDAKEEKHEFFYMKGNKNNKIWL